MPSRLITGSLIALCLSILSIFASKQLTLYIHPRYVTFTTVFVVFCLVLLLIDVVIAKQHTLPKTTLTIVLLASVSIALAPQSLSLQLAANRSESSGAIDISLQTTAQAFTTDFTSAGIRDWVSLLRSNPPAETVVGKKATVEGFIYTVDSQVFIARYQLTCCAVDATPLSIPLALTATTQDDLNEGQWVRVEGVMITVNDSEYRLQLEPTNVTLIDEPREPYVF
jgi:uncharacterized repeat protein (TIGR03943 family)